MPNTSTIVTVLHAQTGPADSVPTMPRKDQSDVTGTNQTLMVAPTETARPCLASVMEKL